MKKPMKQVLFTRTELKSAWLACSNYKGESINKKSQKRVAAKLQSALLEMYLK